MQPEDMVAKTTGTKMNFKANSPGSYICIPPNQYLAFSGEGVKYASVYLEGSSGECVKTIVENYSIPNNKSFIVTANHEIKFQKDGGVIGEDEDSVRHGQQE
ncbi:hypothetical protein AALO_G00177180 [Alosa alosa]|uniref:Uncharacterized protein n=1 Tax=Alosa alosa TaxID=278164 RepID=A0AAV6G7V8_9TELE|nr:hypothetical protein AALO_G00177180 [Alosa alosa]